MPPEKEETMPRARQHALYVELNVEAREALDKITADCGFAEHRPVTYAEVVRQLIHDAAQRGKPVRLR
jgi:hypothetical protein